MTLSRREFLHLGVLGAGGLLLAGLVKCGGGNAGSGTGELTAPSMGELLAARKKAGASDQMDVFLGGEDQVASIDNYLPFFLQRKGGDRLFGSDTRVWITPTIESSAKIAPMGPYKAPWFAYARPEGKGPLLPQGLNAVNFTFTKPGLWALVVETTTGPHLIGTTVVQGAGKGVKAKGESATRVPGDSALQTETPTVDNPRGVSPLCTRQPHCTMHQITLKEAIGNGRPTAFIVATPAFCESRNCGPSLDELIVVQDALKDKVNFVHAEVYANDKPETVQKKSPLSPAMTQWGLQSEPWLFLIDRKGIVASRFEGGFTAGQIRSALDPLVA